MPYPTGDLGSHRPRHSIGLPLLADLAGRWKPIADDQTSSLSLALRAILALTHDAETRSMPSLASTAHTQEAQP
jgi:hypothetical protein